MKSTDDWFHDAVIYELHVRAFADSNGDGVGDFDGLTSRLDYLSDLGVTAVWLLPFYPSPLRDDGYDISDYRSINPDYGNLRGFKRFLNAAHDRNLRVITELVINHTSDQHPWFERARNAPRGSAARDFYVWTDDPSTYADARIIFQDFETSNWTWDPVAGQYYWHRFYSHQPDLNFDNPAVEAAVLEVLDHWLDMGVDGLRLDAVPYLHEREGTNCENLPETHEVLKRIRAHMDSKYEGRMLLAEANQWPEDAAAYFGDGDECHMNFHFPVMPRLFMSLQSENRMPIIDILDQTPTPPEGCQWATFLRNHDELTLEMVTEEERHMMLRAYARDDEMRINLGIRRRLAPLLGNDRRKVELLNAVLFSLPGTPVVYYGDEIGMGDNVYLGDRDGVRTPMQWSSDRNGGFSAANPHRLYLPLITEQEYHYESINVETQQANPASLLAWMRQLISLRTRHRVLGRGDIRFLDPDNAHVLAFIRQLDGEPPMLCVANLSRLAQHVELDLRDFQGATPVEVFGYNRFAPIRDHDYQVTLAPYGFFWFSLVGLSAESEAATMPTLPGSMTEVLRRRAALSRALERWLPQRRWYAGKGRAIRNVTIEDAITLDDDNVALVVANVSFAEGDDQRYAVPVMRIGRDLAETGERSTSPATIAQLDDGALLIDAMSDARGAAVVFAAALRKRSRTSRHGELRGHPRRGRIAKLADDPRRLNVLGVEQSNSSAIIDGRLIAKLVRRLEAGTNPDVELPAHLLATGFERVPGVAATLDVAVAGEPEPANVVVVHDAVTHESDLWVKMLDELGLAIDDVLASDERRDQPVATGIAELVGRRTAELHRALASTTTSNTGETRRGRSPLAPEGFTLLWQRSILQSLRTSIRSTQRDVRRAHRSQRLSDATAEQAAQLDDHLDHAMARFDRLRDEKLDAQRIRIHGDLHLGQILWTGHDIVFIDFEGEPGAPMAQRTIKRSPLADVAGLLRSFDYAGRMAVHTAVERGRVIDVDVIDAWRRRWTERNQDALLEAYFDGVDGTGLVPADDGDRRLLVDIYAMTKALYEIRYELANRPDWVSWPMTAVMEMLPETAARR